MVGTCIQLLQSSIECFEFLWNLSNQMLSICIRMVRISFEWFKFAFDCFKARSNALNFFGIFRIPFEWFKFAFDCFKFALEWLEFLWNGSNLHSIASNLVQMLPICIRMVRIPVEWFEFALDCFESSLNASNLH